MTVSQKPSHEAFLTRKSVRPLPSQIIRTQPMQPVQRAARPVPSTRPAKAAVQRPHAVAAARATQSFGIAPMALYDAAIGMATIPSRKAGMLEVVTSLSPQCSTLHVALNNYTEIPKELARFSNVDPVLTGPDQAIPDRRDSNKFIWCSDPGPLYYLTVDDDIYYPSDYVSRIVESIDKYQQQAFIGVHGMNLHIYRDEPWEPANHKRHRELCVFTNELQTARVVHLIGTGTLGYCTKTIPLKLEDVAVPPYGADHQLAVWAQQHQIPCVIIPRVKGWMTSNDQQAYKGAMCRMSAIDRSMDEWVYRQSRWNHYFPPARTRVGLEHV